MPRLILVSNRLPISARRERGELIVSPSAGGLATGLIGLHEQGDGLWIGWPGETWRLEANELEELHRQLAALRCEPVELTAREVEHYYEHFSNAILWPLLHYELERRVEQFSRRFAEGRISRPANWSGFSVVPRHVEFWQERPFRLHDRLLFVREGEKWRRERLFP